MTNETFWILLFLTLAIHVVLASGLTLQAISLLKRLPESHRRIPPSSAWLLTIPYLNCLWIFVVYAALCVSFASLQSLQLRALVLAVLSPLLYVFLFFTIDPNWAWVLVLLLFIPLRRDFEEIAAKQQGGAKGVGHGML